MVALYTAMDRVLEFRMLLNLKRMLHFNWMDFWVYVCFFQLSVLCPRWAFIYFAKYILFTFVSCISLFDKKKNDSSLCTIRTLLSVGYR